MIREKEQVVIDNISETLEEYSNKCFNECQRANCEGRIVGMINTLEILHPHIDFGPVHDEFAIWLMGGSSKAYVVEELNNVMDKDLEVNITTERMMMRR